MKDLHPLLALLRSGRVHLTHVTIAAFVVETLIRRAGYTASDHRRRAVQGPTEFR